MSDSLDCDEKLARNLKKRDLIAPITSLNFVNNVLLSGEGSNLCVYDVLNGIQLGCQHVLENSRIHGVRVGSRNQDGHLLIIFGQKCLRILKVLNIDNQPRVDIVSDIITIPDLILDAHWLYKEDNASPDVVIATAHNVVWCLDYETSRTWLVAQCEENSILYSAKFFGDSPDNLVLAAGTVFNQVLLWEVKGIKNEDQSTKILHKLIGHEGVIFQINFNDLGTLLVSVSDDRSIRLWRLARSGCGSIQDIECVCVMYGHSARVWDAKLLLEYIVSIGEDAVCNVWNYKGELIKKFTGHLGKSIWSLAISDDQTIIATGGGDASIRLFSLDDVYDKETMATVAAFLPGTQGKVAKKGGVAMDTPRSVYLENDGKLLVMTSMGCLYEYYWKEEMANLDTKHELSNPVGEENAERKHVGESGWTLLLQDSNYSSYSLMAVSLDQKFVAFGNLKGNIKVHDTDFTLQSVEVKPFSSKVLNLLWSNHRSSYGLFSCGPEGIVIWWQVSTDTEQNIQMEQLYTFCIPHCKQRWASAVEVLASEDHVKDCYVVFGDRKGSVHLFDTHDASKETVLHPAHTLPVLHGAIGVTQLCSHDGKLYSAGRDGTYRQYKVCHSKLELIDTKKVFKGLDWVERLVFTASGDILVAGFHTAFFVVWSIAKNKALVQVKCGGGHRAWDLSLQQLQEPSGHEVIFTYLKGNGVYTHKAEIKSTITNPVLKPSFHGRETTCLAYVCDLPSRDDDASRGHLFVTGSEDTTINMMLYDGNTGKTTKVFTAQGHISSVRALSVTKCTLNTAQLVHSKTPQKAPCYTTCTPTQTSHGTECLSCVGTNPSTAQPRGAECFPCSKYLLFSGGGRASLRCWRVDPSALNAVGVNGTISAPISFLSEYSSRSSKHKRRRKLKEGHLHSEIRFMSLSSFPLQVVASENDDALTDVSDGLYGVAAACSDGLVRIFIFDEKECKFFLLCQSQYLVRCVLTVQHLIHQDSLGRHAVVVLAGDTRGKISVWDITHRLVEYLREEADRNVSVETVSEDTVVMGIISEDTIAMETVSEDTVAKENPGFSTKDSSRASGITLQELKSFHVFNAHQSGVNDISVYQGNSSIVLCSGGDDSAVFVAEFRFSSEKGFPRVQLLRQESIHSAHTSSVTGVRVVDQNTIISSSTDQRVKIWSINKSDIRDTTSSKLEEVIFVDVPDVQAIETWETGVSPIVAVCGVGLQILQ